MSTMRLIAARTGQAAFALVAMSVLIWAMLPLTPGDPAERILRGYGRDIEPTPDQIAAFRRETGLDQPLPVQYTTWAGNFLQGRMGQSFLSREPVERELTRRIGATLLL